MPLEPDPAQYKLLRTADILWHGNALPRTDNVYQQGGCDSSQQALQYRRNLRQFPTHTTPLASESALHPMPGTKH